MSSGPQSHQGGHLVSGQALVVHFERLAPADETLSQLLDAAAEAGLRLARVSADGVVVFPKGVLVASRIARRWEALMIPERHRVLHAEAVELVLERLADAVPLIHSRAVPRFDGSAGPLASALSHGA